MVVFTTHFFNDLDLRTFHDLVALRCEVFVVEQNCVYQELDGKDVRCHHVIGRAENGHIVATARIVPPGLSYKEVAIGRVVVALSHRNTHLGHRLMEAVLQSVKVQYGDVPVRISAQRHLADFYTKHGFESTGKEYMEDGIPHVEMLRVAD